jgi:hypothetical protein
MPARQTATSQMTNVLTPEFSLVFLSPAYYFYLYLFDLLVVLYILNSGSRPGFLAGVPLHILKVALFGYLLLLRDAMAHTPHAFPDTQITTPAEVRVCSGCVIAD